MSPQRVLIVQTAFLGDVVLTTPLVEQTARLFPSATIDVLAIPQTSVVLRNNPHVRSVIEFDKRGNKRQSFFRILRALRKNGYDLAITPHGSVTTALLLWLAGIAERWGFDRGIASLLYTRKVSWPKTGPVATRNLRLLDPAGFTYDSHELPQTRLYPDEQDRALAREILQNAGVIHAVAMAPGSVWPTKRWDAAGYGRLIRMLEEKGVDVILTGAPEERELCLRIATMAGIPDARVLAGRTGILQSAALLADCLALVTNDNGAMHLANAMQTPVVAIFGPTVTAFGFAPLGKGDRVLEVELPCRPCGKHGHQRCPLGHHACMNRIQPEQVFDTVMELLQQDHSSDTKF